MSAPLFALHAFDLDTGLLRWTASLPTGDGVSDVVASSGVVFVGIDSAGLQRFIGFDASDGRVLWEVDLPDVGVSRLRCVSGAVAVAVLPMRLIAYDLVDGSPRWDLSSPARKSTGSGSSIEDGHPVHSEAVELASMAEAFIVGTRRNVMALSSITGDLLWYCRIGTVETIDVQGDAAYVVDMQNLLHRLDGATGASLWSFDCETEAEVNPVIAEDVAFVRSDAGDLHVVEVRDGTVRWRLERDGTGGAFAAFGVVSAGRTFVSSCTGTLSCLDVASGEMLWSRDFGKVMPSPRVERASSEWCLVSVGGELQLLDVATGAEVGRWAPKAERWGLLRAHVSEGFGIVLAPGQVSRLDIEDLSIA